jgi:hypothetical protein
MKRAPGTRALLAALALGAVTCADRGEVTRQSVQASTSCAPLQVEPTRLFRQMSLDLRGAPPRFEEIEAVAQAGRIPPELVDRMLQSPEFLDQSERWHADLLWPNIDNFALQATPVRLTSGGPNPELALDVLNSATAETTCPTSGTGRLTAVVCCTPNNPNHPACCLPRNNGRYDANDPACVAKSQALGAMFIAYGGTGDRPLRGGLSGCDEALEYPPARVTVGDRRWLHQPDGRPYYVSPRNGQVRYYYDEDQVPLPFDDWTHCPNYCRALVGTGANNAFQTADFRQKFRVEAGRRVDGDHPLARCDEGFTEVVNTCNNARYAGPDESLRGRREGYVLRSTYWTDGRLLKVCAYDAQERTNSISTGLACAPRDRMDPSCGCGANGENCMPSQGFQSALPSGVERAAREGLNQEPLHIVRSVIGRDEDYFNAYTTRRSFVTGALSFLYRRQLGKVYGVDLVSPGPQIPEARYDDPNWHEFVRGPEHAGVLTTPAYLARFPTWRSRINQFRTMLMCRPFEPSPGPLPAADDACNREPNLARRCGCQSCHTAIEPLGAYWGRWAERSARYLDPSTFPSADPNCALCAVTGQGCTTRCRTHYVTSTLDADGSRYAGTLLGYLYRDGDELSRIDQGPAALVANALSTGEMQSCTVQTVWRRLVGRPMSTNETTTVLPTLVRRFEASHHNYRQLVRAVINAPAYRRID